jgi:hypothetical protein
MRAGIYQLTRQVVSLPALAGAKLGDGQRLTSAPNVREPRRTSAIETDESPVARAREELRVHKRSQQRIANVALQPPQALGLGGRQAKSGHFHVFTLNSLKHFVDTHGFASEVPFDLKFPSNRH